MRIVSYIASPAIVCFLLRRSTTFGQAPGTGAISVINFGMQSDEGKANIE